MNKLRTIIDFSKQLGANIGDLVSVTAPSNYKTLLDISLNLYNDEVARYKFLEEKSSRI